MSTFAWPAGLLPQTVSWGIQKSATQSRSPMAGSVESIEFPGQFWRCSITLPERSIANGGAASAFFERIAGGAERVLVPYWPRLLPSGTMRASPTLSAPAVRGELSLSISTSGSLLAGDMIGVGAQVFRVLADSFASGGVLVVPLVNRVRGPIAAGQPVIWNSPTGLFLMPSQSFAAVYSPRRQSGVAVDLEEAGS